MFKQCSLPLRHHERLISVALTEGLCKVLKCTGQLGIKLFQVDDKHMSFTGLRYWAPGVDLLLFNQNCCWDILFLCFGRRQLPHPLRSCAGLTVCPIQLFLGTLWPSSSSSSSSSSSPHHCASSRKHHMTSFVLVLSASFCVLFP